MNNQPTRARQTVLALMLLLSLTLTACGGQAGGGELVVLDWSGYEYDTYWVPYAEAYPDNLPSYSFFADDSEAFAKVQSGFDFDVIHPCSSWWQLYVDSGLVQPIDTSRLSNFDTLYPKLAEMGQFNGEQYFIPWEWGYESLIVRTDLVEEVPDSWLDLWDPQYAGHVSVYDSAETAFISAATAMGIDPYNATDAEIEQIKDTLIELKSNLLTYWTDYTEINQLLAQGDVWVAGNAWNDAYAALVDEGYEVSYINPVEGRLGWVCGYGISAESDDVDMAYEFLNALIDAQSMANMGNDYYYGVASQAATDLLDPYFVELMELENPAILEQSNFYQPLTNEQREMMEDVWSQVRASN